MTELKRWVDDAAPDGVLLLLDSARHEKAPPRVLQRTLVALGATSATTTAVAAAGSGVGVGAGAKVGASVLAIVVKWGSAGLVGGTVLAGAVAGIGRLSADNGQNQRAHTPTEPTAAQTNPNPELPRPSAPAAPPAVEVERAPEVRASAVRPVGSASLAPAKPAVPATAAEIELLDAARARLRANDGVAVERLLASYESGFTPTHFEPEVLYLRMQSSVLRGARAEAKRLATLIVTRYPQSPGVGQAEALLRAEEKSPAE